MNVESNGKSPHRDSSSEEIDLLAQGSTSSRPADTPRELGDFRIIEKIASGGMATVYEAEQISLKRRVALKILPSHLSDSANAVRRFQREAEAGRAIPRSYRSTQWASTTEPTTSPRSSWKRASPSLTA